MTNASMPHPPVPARYSGATILLHWSIALVILAGAVLGLMLEEIPREQRLPWANLHCVLGFVALLLTFARLAARGMTAAPPLPGAGWLLTAAKAGHAALYALTLALPLTGLVMWWLRGRGLDLWLFQIPTPFAADRASARTMEDVHKALFWLSAVVVAGHVGVALVHQFVWKDGLMARMRPS